MTHLLQGVALILSPSQTLFVYCGSAYHQMPCSPSQPVLLQYDCVAACENMYYVVINPPADDFFVLAGPCSVI